MQERNVAFGGSLVRRLHDDVGRFDHRMRRDVPFDWKYRKAHPIALAAGSVLERVAGPGPHMVNSLHGQGVARPGPRVRAGAKIGRASGRYSGCQSVYIIGLSVTCKKEHGS